MQKEKKTYHYVRFRWWTAVDLTNVLEEFKEAKFNVELKHWPTNEHEFSLYKDERDELRVESDTLLAFISPYRAVLSQRSPSPFTTRDAKLRKMILDLFPRNRPTPFPWEFSREPKFELAQKNN